MNRNYNFKNWSILIILIALTSCNTYKYGYISEIPYKKAFDYLLSDELSQLKVEKEKLNFQAKEVMQSIEEQQKRPKALQANELNLLFENLQRQYKIDSILHYKYLYSTNNIISYTAEQMMLESAASYNLLFQHNKNIRRIINRGNLAYSVPPKFLAKSQKFLWLTTHKSDIRKQIKTLDDNSYLKETNIDNSFLAWYMLSGTASKLVASVISMSHLEPKPEKYVHRLMPLLESCDIVCQKSRNRLTDKFIPGYFGHAAIYLGDSLFVEAILNGTVISNPYQFAEGDSYLIIRHKHLSSDQKERIIALSKAQVGKKYDFQYDTESPNEITCAELVFLAYDFIKWETDHTAGRYVITPDNIVSTACSEPELEIISYFDNKLSLDHPKTSFIKKLLKK